MMQDKEYLEERASEMNFVVMWLEKHTEYLKGYPDTLPYIDSRKWHGGVRNYPLIDCAKAHNVKLTQTVAGRSTGTDADEIGVSRTGVPTVLLSLPEKYLHTSVETISLDTMEEGARLLAHFISELDARWEEDLWI